MLLARDRNGLQPCMDPERSQQVANMISHGLRAQVKLLRDLLGRAAALEEPQDLGLAWGEMRRHRIVGLLFDICNLSEDADQTMPLHQRTGADVDLHAIAVWVEEADR